MNFEPILIVPGEPESIFYEIFFKSLKRYKIKSPIVFICSYKHLILNAKKYDFKKKINLISFEALRNKKIKNKEIHLINIEITKQKDFLKLKSNITRIYINKCFEVAIKLIKLKVTKKFLNGPINKKNFLKKKFPGITEFISYKFNKKKTGMLIYNRKLSVCPITTHIPLKNVAKLINKKLVQEKIILVNNFYKKNFKLKPKIAVCGLNPHCESTSVYNEDDRIIKPAIQGLKNKNIKVYGPFSADTIFNKKNRKFYDVVIGMYHDQVLTPIKALFEFNAINITIGLPFFRVTPDHGPNKIMINKNLSDPTSLIRALEFLDNR